MNSAKLLPDGEYTVGCTMCGSGVMKVVVDKITMKVESLKCPVCESYIDVEEGQLDLDLFRGCSE